MVGHFLIQFRDIRCYELFMCVQTDTQRSGQAIRRDVKARRSVKFTIHLHLVPRLKMSGSVPLWPHRNRFTVAFQISRISMLADGLEIMRQNDTSAICFSLLA
jgi:hypothetical protein